MQRIFITATLLFAVIFLTFCNSSKKATATAETAPKKPAFNWTNNIQPMMVAQCGPCHVTGKGNKLAMDNLDNVKNNIDDIIRRIELNPGERGYMPFKRAKLSDSTIAMVKTWKTDNFPQ
ncbi:MAG: cytochrome c [Ferruginibacter sp.]